MLLPYGTATAERQMMAAVPGRRVLSSSDLFSPDGAGGWFTPQYVSEFLSATSRYGVVPETVFGMHYGPTPYSALRTWLDSVVPPPNTPHKQ